MLNKGRNAMSNKKIVLLDGRRPGDAELTSTLALLTDVMTGSGAEVQVFCLRELKLAHCIGCFGCWLETPGVCRYGEAGRGILQAVIQSDTTILFTPVVFGGYSSQLKQIVDRFASMVLPYFHAYHGEAHHRPRYRHFPRLVGIGVQPEFNAKAAEIFKLLVGRNAINFHAPSYAAEVVRSADDVDVLREKFRLLLCRKDPRPWGESIKYLLPSPDSLANGPEVRGPRRACLIVGSPKTLSPSTSSVLGNYLLERLSERSWETESLTLRASLLKPQGRTDLLAAVDRADLLLFAFPLYVDTLPFLMTKALEIIADHRKVFGSLRPQRVVAISNNGFMESYQNNLALSICRQFAAETGMTWMGALAMGAGEAISGGQPLKPFSSFGVPCAHVIEALKVAGAALAQGQAVPAEAVQGIAQNPIPHAPFAIWRWMAMKTANKEMWDKRAAENGISKTQMLAKPFVLA
jgi:multimeric flavodoxin WrbA